MDKELDDLVRRVVASRDIHTRARVLVDVGKRYLSTGGFHSEIHLMANGKSTVVIDESSGSSLALAEKLRAQIDAAHCPKSATLYTARVSGSDKPEMLMVSVHDEDDDYTLVTPYHLENNQVVFGPTSETIDEPQRLPNTKVC